MTVTKTNQLSEFSWSFILIPLTGLLILLIVLFNFNNKLAFVDNDFISEMKHEVFQKTMDDYVPTASRYAGVPGLSASIIRKGKLVEIYSYGVAHSIKGSEINESSIFEAASLSKPLTAWAILKLVSDGRLTLDSLIQDAGKQYTIRQLLSHSAGFDNQLGNDIVPVKKSGEFSYAGQGYLKLGALITEVTGMPFDEYMNQVVLKELGMTNSRFGTSDDRSTEANPHISVTMPQVIGTVLLVICTILFTVLLWIVIRIMKRTFTKKHQQIIFLISCLISLILPIQLLGMNNGLRFAIVNVISIGCVLLLMKGFKEWKLGLKRYGWIAIGLLSFVLLVYSLFFRPPVPLKDRLSAFTPAAGLKTTSQDYSRFIIELSNPSHLAPELLEEMFTSQIEVNENIDWGLGVGIQKGKEKVIWHWGVNYPGYQCLFVAWPERGDGMVILMNGGPISLTSDAPRFKGLELARNMIIKTFGGQHYDYWQQVH